MSWSDWNEDEERKEYEVKGAVTISTEEYRDLIAEVYKLKAKGKKEHEDWYDEYKQNSELKKKSEALQKAVDTYNKYINSSELRKADYTTYLKELKLSELEAEEDE